MCRSGRHVTEGRGGFGDGGGWGWAAVRRHAVIAGRRWRWGPWLAHCRGLWIVQRERAVLEWCVPKARPQGVPNRRGGFVTVRAAPINAKR
jgi:hypothetical protein